MNKEKRAEIIIGVWPFQKKLKMTLAEIQTLIKDGEGVIQMLKDTAKNMEKDIHE